MVFHYWYKLLPWLCFSILVSKNCLHWCFPSLKNFTCRLCILFKLLSLLFCESPIESTALIKATFCYPFFDMKCSYLLSRLSHEYLKISFSFKNVRLLKLKLLLEKDDIYELINFKKRRNKSNPCIFIFQK